MAQSLLSPDRCFTAFQIVTMFAMCVISSLKIEYFLEKDSIFYYDVRLEEEEEKTKQPFFRRVTTKCLSRERLFTGSSL